ncbi:hypothetical protein B0H14DRAFT_3459090 [Mycena olivaceomarginata]|nr:hypothetical protein B0H14DRAFT_3459090 [Mycena olivaceomarginata]
MAPHSLHKPLSHAHSSGPDSVDVQMHSNLEEANKSSLPVGTADVSVAVQPVPLMHSIIEETDPLLVETADISVDVLTDTRAVEAADETTAHSSARHFSPGSQALLIPLQYSCNEAGETVSAQHALISILKSFEIKDAHDGPLACFNALDARSTRTLAHPVAWLISAPTKTTSPRWPPRACSCPLRTDHIWSPYIFILHPSEQLSGLDSVSPCEDAPALLFCVSTKYSHPSERTIL